MHFSQHAIVRLQERTGLTRQIVEAKIAQGDFVPLGVCPKKNTINKLLFDPINNNFAIAVHDEKKNSIVTILYPDYNKWEIDLEILDRLRSGNIHKGEKTANNSEFLKVEIALGTKFVTSFSYSLREARSLCYYGEPDDEDSVRQFLRSKRFILDIKSKIEQLRFHYREICFLKFFMKGQLLDKIISSDNESRKKISAVSIHSFLDLPNNRNVKNGGPKRVNKFCLLDLWETGYSGYILDLDALKVFMEGSEQFQELYDTKLKLKNVRRDQIEAAFISVKPEKIRHFCKVSI